MALELVSSLNLEVVETIDLPGRAERRRSIPQALLSGPVGPLLRDISADGTVWHHQSIAFEKLLRGENIVVATGTASGKSLIFQTLAFHKILGDDSSRVLVFYPLKALASDQHERWQRMATLVGLDASCVVRIDGDTPVADRSDALESARIVLMTPDVCHAWLMRNVGSGLVRRFMERLTLLVLDEAHVYESVFGSNVAFLLRRMIIAKRRATQQHSKARQLQVIGATATIRDPAEHLHRLTGLHYSVIDESENGAPFFPRMIFHVNGAEYGPAGEEALTDIVRGVKQLSTRRRFIAFLDSRQGVERIVRRLNDRAVLPYRSGYEAADRKQIEKALRDGSLDGVIATSALELGIDISDMEVGVNLGVPESRKAFRQRIGRVGRSGPGVFFVIAPPGAFRRFGETFRDYYEGSVEPSYLYLGNRFIQFAQARCLLDEVEVLGGDQSTLPAGVDWPAGFGEIVKFAKPGGGRPREFDFIAQIGADAPHFNYPLRQVGEANFEIKEGRGDFQQRVGDIATNQAIREAYPGATYLHMGRAYKVQEWSTRSFDRSIRVTSLKEPARTRPILKKTVTFSLAPDGIVDGRIKHAKNGLVAEVHLQVNESVEGYTIAKTAYLYRDLRAENPNMSRKQRDFRTTGVLLRISDTWFSGTQQAKVRERVADGLLGIISRDRSISPRDIDATHTNIAILTEFGPQRLTDAVVIYDSVYGGLRLTEDLFVEFERYVTQLDKAADLAREEAIVGEETTVRLIEWTKTLGTGQGGQDVITAPPDGWLQVYKPGSFVSILHNGNFVEREIVEPKLADIFGTGTKTLFYSYRVSGGIGLVPHDQIQATGQEWSWILWNPETGEFQELEVTTE
ncbi:DEAD/DEAH box helicase domain-containing protein [Tepidamorphus gemmatus]|uniref:DEAD/DEAH box helicase domain-containing protein n=1 Tax=Tepidamorphus gemmatus TaxID=747076 RepID=A0A4R3M1Y4_9HYPH|nr:DEAD/DEAH box helicase domain-containing protein [Tepidamorphus gemmatus]